ncbi:MAG TPA: hypothetical protein VGC56_07130 [Allosphingosinicella sp.]
MADIKLNFINRSNERDNTKIVLFQKAESTGYSELPLAWLVIERCGMNARHPFTYPMTMQVTTRDSWGNYQEPLNAQPGQAFSLSTTASGDTLELSGKAGYPDEVDVCNNLSAGSIDAVIFKAGKPLAQKSSIVPADKASFKFLPKLWIGAVSQIVEGEVMDSAVVDQLNTKFDLTGIASADIVMTGGGAGPNASPYVFQLENVVTL